MIPATEGVLRLQMKSKSSIPCTALGCIPLLKSVLTSDIHADCFVPADLLYEASCLVVEEGVRERGEHTAGRAETGDVVVGRLHAIGSAGQRSGLGHDGYFEEVN